MAGGYGAGSAAERKPSNATVARINRSAGFGIILPRPAPFVVDPKAFLPVQLSLARGELHNDQTA